MIADRQTHTNPHTDRQTDRQTDTLITILRCAIGGGVISSSRVNWCRSLVQAMVAWSSQPVLHRQQSDGGRSTVSTSRHGTARSSTESTQPALCRRSTRSVTHTRHRSELHWVDSAGSVPALNTVSYLRTTTRPQWWALVAKKNFFNQKILVRFKLNYFF